MYKKTLYDSLKEDIRYQEGIKACINCGTCTAICPAAEVYDYHPRNLVDIVQSKNDEAIEELLKGDTIIDTGYCVHFDHMSLEVFPEQGPVWQWVKDNHNEVLEKVGANYKGTG